MSEYSIALEKQLVTARLHARLSQMKLHADDGPQVAAAFEVAGAAITGLGEAHFIDGPICGLLETAAIDMPPWVPTAPHLFSPMGYAWFAKPIALPERSWGGGGTLGAISWGLWHAGTEKHRFYMPTVDRPANTIIVLPYVWDDTGTIREIPTCFTPVSWPLGCSTAEVITEVVDAETDRRVETDPRTAAALTARIETELRVFAALMAFVEQKILIAGRRDIDRASRRRAARLMLHEPTLNVIELRRRESDKRPDGEAVDVEWSWRWIVRGHWHPYWYGKQGEQREKRWRWLIPYLKGPGDRPLKQPKPTVFAVVR